MEKILRFIGNVFLRIANAIHEARDTADSFFFDVFLEGTLEVGLETPPARMTEAAPDTGVEPGQLSD